MKISLPEKNTVLKMLIATGIFAILLSLYTQYGKPYLNERALEKQDAIRIRDIDALSLAVQDVLKASSTAYLGEPNTVYISIPSDDPTCANLDLPSLPEGWSYNCASQENYKKADGTGWVPVDLTNTVSILPVDPSDTPNTLNYHSYVASTSEYSLSTTLDSKRLLVEKAREDLGTDDTRYEKGSPLHKALLEKASLLVKYISFDEKMDLSDFRLANQNLLSFSNPCLWDGCLYNQTGNIGRVSFPSPISFSSVSTYSYGFQFKIDKIPEQNIQIFNPGANRIDVNIEGKSGALFIWFSNNAGESYLLYKSEKNEWTDNNWHQLFIVKDLTSISIYIDGEKKEGVLTSVKTLADLGESTITLLPNMAIDSIRFYERSLSSTEIEKLVQY